MPHRKTRKKTDRDYPARGSKYRWSDWQDGEWHELKQGKDFKRSVEHFRSYVCFRAREDGFEVMTRKLSNKVLAVRFTPA